MRTSSTAPHPGKRRFPMRLVRHRYRLYVVAVIGCASRRIPIARPAGHRVPLASANDFTNRNTTFMTWNLLHLARLLKDADGIPAHGNQRSGSPSLPVRCPSRRSLEPVPVRSHYVRSAAGGLPGWASGRLGHARLGDYPRCAALCRD